MERTPPEEQPFLFRDLKRWRWHLLAALSVVAFIAWGAYALGARQLMEQVVGVMRAGGALAFFAAMALLPLVGFPLLPFSLAAGPVFAATLGEGGVIACATLAVALNAALAYGIASTWMRSWVERLLGRLGYRPPALSPGRDWLFIGIVRLAPGLPFWAQNYLLGLMHVRFGVYLAITTLIHTVTLTGLVMFGAAVVEGNGDRALAAVGVIGVVGVAMLFLRRRIGRAAP